MNQIDTINRRQGLEEYLKSLGCRVLPYGNASHAFKDILLHLKKNTTGSVPNVVMPSYIPAKLYRTVLAAGYEPKFYDIGNGCQFDPQQVEDLVDDRTTSLFIIHYFGYPTDLNSAKDIAARHRLTLIEDCAHVLIAAHGKRPLGAHGDYAIFSSRKMLQLSDGGMLAINTPLDGFVPTYDGRVRSAYTCSHFVLSRAKQSYLQLSRGNDFLRLARVSEIGWIDPKRPIQLKVRRMSRFASFVGKVADIQRISSIRQAHYRRLLGILRDFEFLTPVYRELPGTWTPYSLPMIVEQGKRPRLTAELLKHGISCGLGWPESPFCKYADGTRTLSGTLIEFPVHPLISELQFERIADACKSFRKNYISA